MLEGQEDLDDGSNNILFVGGSFEVWGGQKQDIVVNCVFLVSEAERWDTEIASIHRLISHLRGKEHGVAIYIDVWIQESKVHIWCGHCMTR